MNAWRVCLSLLGLFLSGPSLILAQEGSVEVERRGPAVQPIGPGEALTVPFRVTNQGAETVRVETSARVPSGWLLVSGGEPFDLDGGSGALRLVTIAVPPHAPAGEHVIRYGAGGSGHLAHDMSVDSVLVRVARRTALHLALAELPERVAAGEPYRGDLFLDNRGNTRVQARIEAESSGGYPVEVEPALVALDPNGSAPIVVTVRTDDDLARQRREVLRVRAISVSPEGEEVAVSRGLAVAPRARSPSEQGRELHRLPLRATVRAVSQEGAAAPLELAGSGRLFDTGSERVDLLLRGPGTQSSVLGQRDEYRLRFRSDRVEVLLGDQVYSLTPLTERGRYSFGAGGQVSFGGWHVGGHHARDRRLGRGAQSAGQIGYGRGGTGIDLNYLTRVGSEGGSVWSVRGHTQAFPGTWLEVEYGAGLDGPPRTTGSSIELAGRHPRFGYRLRHLRTDRGFPGSSDGIDHRHAGLDLNLWGGFRFGTHATRSERPSHWGEFEGVRVNQVFTANLTHDGLGSLEYRASERAMLNDGPVHHDDAESLRLRLGWSPGRWSLVPSAEVGRSLDRLTGATGAFHVLQARASHRSARSGAASASLEWFAGRPVPVRAADEGVRGRLNWSGTLGTANRAGVNLVGTRYLGERGGMHGFADVTLTQEMFSGHELSGRVRAMVRGRGAFSPDPMFVLSYTIPLDVPVSASRQWGRVTGRIYDAESGGGLGDVLVRVGDREALTDQSGNLEVRGIEPGDHRIEVDRMSLGAGRLPVSDAMLIAGARAGQETRVEIAIVRAAELSGAVRWYELAPGTRPDDPEPEMVDAGGVRNAVVVLTRGSEVHRRTTDAEGRFRFSELRPGDWTVSVAADVPDWHRLEPDTTHLALEAGAVEDLTVRVIPTPRTLRLIPRTPQSEDRQISSASSSASPAARRSNGLPPFHL